MNAGSSPDTGPDLGGFVIPITEPPVVEIDTEAGAAYIRLRQAAVTRTGSYPSDLGLVMLDYNAAGEVVGIEVIGQREFSIRELLKLVPVQAAESVLDRTRYVSAKLQTA